MCVRFPKDLLVIDFEELNEPVQLGAKKRGLHDALEDCRIATDVLRQVTG